MAVPGSVFSDDGKSWRRVGGDAERRDDNRPRLATVAGVGLHRAENSLAQQHRFALDINMDERQRASSVSPAVISSATASRLPSHQLCRE